MVFVSYSHSLCTRTARNMSTKFGHTCSTRLDLHAEHTSKFIYMKIIMKLDPESAAQYNCTSTSDIGRLAGMITCPRINHGAKLCPREIFYTIMKSDENGLPRLSTCRWDADPSQQSDIVAVSNPQFQPDARNVWRPKSLLFHVRMVLGDSQIYHIGAIWFQCHGSSDFLSILVFFIGSSFRSEF